MDSVTQAVLGASLAAVCAPAPHQRKALLVGAALGTLPDLDVFIDHGDAVKNFTYHRSFSHSLFVLVPFATLLWLLLKRCWTPVRDGPLRWLLGLQLALVTHPLLDAHTAYGTQLWWPLTPSPAMWSTLFIIDPLYTVPLVVGVAIAAFRVHAERARKVLTTGIVLSSTYLAWSWLAKTLVETKARATLEHTAAADAPLFSSPTPFNTLLWRAVVVTEDGFWEGYDSLLIDEGPMVFERYESDVDAMARASHVWAVRRLEWFSSGFSKATVQGNTLVVTDHRMGQEPKFVFRHAVAERRGEHWVSIPSELLPASFDTSDIGAVLERILVR